MTQHDLAVKAMFIKGENAERAKRKPTRHYLLNADGTRATRVLPADKLRRLFPVYRDIGAFINRPGQNMARHGYSGAA